MLTENQENEPEVGYRARLWFALALAHLNPDEAVPASWRLQIPEVDFEALQPVSSTFLF